MRGYFIKTLVEIAEKDSRVVLLTGDLGYMALEPFTEKFPERFFNVGVAEQNMIGIATGLAKEGYIPFIYSIVTFATLRPYEFIRHGPILHQLPVRIVGVGGGVEYSANGITHFGLEDVGIMRVQPGISVIAPADYKQASTALDATWDLPGPVYYRIGKDDKTTIAGLGGRFDIGRAQFVGQGKDVLLIAMGSIAAEVSKAVEILSEHGVSSTMMIIASVTPPPKNDLINALSKFKLALTVEAHYITGGVGSLVSEIVAENNLNCKIIRCGIKETPDGTTGSLDYLYKRFKLSGADIANTALDEQKKTGDI